MISKNSNTFDTQLLVNVSDKTNLKKSDKCNVLSNLSIYYTQKNKKELNHKLEINYKFK